MQQALEYAEILDVPFAYSSNGDAFLEHDRTATGSSLTREIPLSIFQPQTNFGIATAPPKASPTSKRRS